MKTFFTAFFAFFVVLSHTVAQDQKLLANTEGTRFAQHDIRQDLRINAAPGSEYRRVQGILAMDANGLTPENFSDGMVAIFSRGRMIEMKPGLVELGNKGYITYYAYFSGYDLERPEYTFGLMVNVTKGETQRQVRVTGPTSSKSNTKPRLSIVETAGHFDASHYASEGGDWRDYFIENVSIRVYKGDSFNPNPPVNGRGIGAIIYTPSITSEDIQEMELVVYKGNKEIARSYPEKLKTANNSSQTDPRIDATFRFEGIPIERKDDHYFAIRFITTHMGQPNEVLYRQANPAEPNSYNVLGHRPYEPAVAAAETTQ